MTRHLVLFGGGIAIAVMAACASNHPKLRISPENYPAYSGYKGGASRDGISEAETGQSLEKLWQIKFKFPLYYSPAMADNYLFQPASDKKIHVININNGVEIGEIKLRRQLGCTPELADSLMAICEDGDKSQILVINYIAGIKIWSKSTYGLCLPPAIVDDLLYWVDGNRKINCARLNTGEIIWSAESPAGFDTGPVIGNEWLVVALDDGSMACHDRNKGSLLWHVRCGSRTNASPAISGDQVFLCFGDGGVACYDMTNGSKSWYHMDKPRLFYSPSVDSSGVYYGTGDGRFVKLDRNSGEVIWEFTTPLPIRGAALITANTAIFASLDSKVYMLDKNTGQLVNSTQTGGMVTAVPAIYGDRLFIAGQDKNLYCFLLGDDK